MSQPSPAKEETQTQGDLVLGSICSPHDGKWEEITLYKVLIKSKTEPSGGGEVGVGLGVGGYTAGPGTGPNKLRMALLSTLSYGFPYVETEVPRSAGESDRADRLIYAHLVLPERAGYGCTGLLENKCVQPLLGEATG